MGFSCCPQCEAEYAENKYFRESNNTIVADIHNFLNGITTTYRIEAVDQASMLMAIIQQESESAYGLEYFEILITRLYTYNLIAKYNQTTPTLCPRILTLMRQEILLHDELVSRCTTKTRVMTILLMNYYNTFYDIKTREFHPQLDKMIFHTLSLEVQDSIIEFYTDALSN